MKVAALTRLCMAAAITIGGAAAAPRAQAQGAPVWQKWLLQLKKSGYRITQGSATVTSVAYCQQVIVPVFGTCFSSDPGDPYVVPLMPVGKGYVDPYFGAFANQTLPDGTVIGQSFRLDTTEAELVIVTLPPLAGYFSYEGYTFSRLIADYPNGVGVVSPDPARGDLYASYNNSINNTDIQRQSGLSFGQGTVGFITTPNSALSADMISQFSTAGGNPAQLFVDPMGSGLRLGLDAKSDDFSMLIRYLVPQNAASGNNWLNNAANNVLVYRIEQPPSLSTVRYGAQTLRQRGYNVNESVYAHDVAELSGLMKGWLATQEGHGSYKVKTAVSTMKADSSGTPVSGGIGPLCIQNGSLCNGDEQDAIHWAVAVGKVAANKLFVIAGVNAAATNNTTVFSLSVEDSAINTGVVTVSQINPIAAGFSLGDVTGSAELALKALGLWGQASLSLQTDAPNLFVQIFTRNCTAQQTYCGQPFTTVVSSTEIPYQDNISIFQRAYALPGSDAGPNPYYVSPPNAIY